MNRFNLGLSGVLEVDFVQFLWKRQVKIFVNCILNNKSYIDLDLDSMPLVKKSSACYFAI